MSVTFNRAQLIRVAKTALAEHDKAQREYTKAVEKYKAEHARSHTQSTRDYATRLRDALTKALKRSGPIKSSDLISATGEVRISSDFLYHPPHDYDIKKRVTIPTGLLKPAEVIETRSLLTVLESATGDTVSVNELKLLGLKNLQPVFAAASAELDDRKLRVV